MVTSTAKTAIPLFSSQQLEGISKTLGDTTDGLKGSEIGHLLRECAMPDPTPGITKWQRLYNALVGDQNRSQIGTHIMQFIVKAMNPARYTTEPVLFRTRLDRLNSVLAFAGYQITEKGKVRATDAAGTISEALDRANRLHSALVQRAVHADVLTFCRAEIVQENYFHAVFEAMKSITAKIRRLSGLSKDVVELVHEAFGQRYGPPVLAINPFLTETQRGEQNGFVNLLKGLYGTIRNPLAHDPKVEWDMSEQDALDILTVISLVHRKLDVAYRYRP
jgi:uncharacterized protein (TIGR02391 family)